MKHDDNTPMVIFSVGKQALASVPRSAMPAQGCYKGDCEPSYIMTAADFYAANVPALLRDDGQESVLYLDNQRSAWLRYGPGYADADAVYIGRWREVGERYASLLANYTIFEGRYFAAY